MRDKPMKLFVPVRITARSRSSATSTPTVANSGWLASEIVSGGPGGTLMSPPPVVVRSRSGSSRNDGRLPFGFVVVFLVQLIQVDHHIVPVFVDREAIQPARGPAAVFDVQAIGLEARMMLGALELAVLVVPPDRGVLV